MMKCRKCGKEFPNKMNIDGKIRVLSSRKYCLECSPFGMHNTRAIQDNIEKIPICKRCGKILQNRRRKYCYSCSNAKRREKIGSAISEFVGNKCWHCGFYVGEKTYYALCFHHIDPQTKKFGLSVSELCSHNASIVKEEISKCVCLCHNCHALFHYTNLITQEMIEESYNNFWEFNNFDNLIL